MSWIIGSSILGRQVRVVVHAQSSRTSSSTFRVNWWFVLFYNSSCYHRFVNKSRTIYRAVITTMCDCLFFDASSRICWVKLYGTTYLMKCAGTMLLFLRNYISFPLYCFGWLKHMSVELEQWVSSVHSFKCSFYFYLYHSSPMQKFTVMTETI